MLLLCASLRASECPQLAPYCEQQCLTEQELEAVKACSKTYNNLVVTNAIRTSNLNVTTGSTLGGVTNVNGTLNVTGNLTLNGVPIAGAAFGSFANLDPVVTTSNITWTSSGVSLANPNNNGFSLNPATGVITITNAGIYLYSFGVSLLGAGSNTIDDPQIAIAQLMQNGSNVVNTVNNFTIPFNLTASFAELPFELSSSGLLLAGAGDAIALNMTLSSSWSMPAANTNAANAYLTIIQVN